VAVALPLVGVVAVSVGRVAERWRVVTLVATAAGTLGVALLIIGDVLAAERRSCSCST
jgi:hypothetical protein